MKGGEGAGTSTESRQETGNNTHQIGKQAPRPETVQTPRTRKVTRDAAADGGRRRVKDQQREAARARVPDGVMPGSVADAGITPRRSCEGAFTRVRPDRKLGFFSQPKQGDPFPHELVFLLRGRSPTRVTSKGRCTAHRSYISSTDLTFRQPGGRPVETWLSPEPAQQFYTLRAGSPPGGRSPASAGLSRNLCCVSTGSPPRPRSTSSWGSAGDAGAVSAHGGDGPAAECDSADRAVQRGAKCRAGRGICRT